MLNCSYDTIHLFLDNSQVVKKLKYRVPNKIVAFPSYDGSLMQYYQLKVILLRLRILRLVVSIRSSIIRTLSMVLCLTNVFEAAKINYRSSQKMFIMKNVSCMFSANSGNNEMFRLKAEKGLLPWTKIFFQVFQTWKM